MMMRSSYFLTQTESEANICNLSVPLTANCAGTEYFYAPFKLISRRLDYSFVYVLNGFMEFEIKGKSYSLASNSFMIIPPSEITYKTKRDFLNYYWLQITGSEVYKLLSRLNLECERGYSVKMCDNIEKIISDINTEFIFNDDLFDVSVAARITELFSTLSRSINSKGKTLTESCEYIHRHYDANITVPHLAEMEHVSVSHYRLLFKKAFGISPMEYITKVRINAACHYLINTSYSVAEIAVKVGYKDPLYLSRMFHKQTGISATEYRKKAKTLLR